MTDVFPKFLIVDDYLLLEKCKFHKELIEHKNSVVKGGGWWKVKVEEEKIIFHGDSHDFGEAKIEDIKECVKTGRITDRRNRPIRWLERMKNPKFFHLDVYTNIVTPLN